MKKSNGIQWIFFFTGLIIMGLGVTLTVKGQRFGVSSWDVLHVGLFKNFGLSIGLWSIIIGIIIITVASIGLRRFPTLGTIINMTVVGLFIDFFNWLLPDPHTFMLQFFNFALGIVLLAIGAGVYISANLGAGPRDTLMLWIVNKFGCSITIARTAMEISVVIIGYLLGGPVGIGTILMVFALGPIVQVSLEHSKKFLEKCVSKRQSKQVVVH